MGSIVYFVKIKAWMHGSKVLVAWGALQRGFLYVGDLVGACFLMERNYFRY